MTVLPDDLRDDDLTLLISLRALLTTSSVGAAAKLTGRSQPAMSRVLSQLRERFRDPLLVREGRGLVPTPRGLELLEPLEETLAHAVRLHRAPDAFDPRTTTGTFRLAAPDLLSTFLAGVIAAIGDEAPLAKLHIQRPHGSATSEALATGRCDLVVDGDISVPETARALPLGTITWATLARPDHPFAKNPSRERWVAAPHIEVQTGIERPSAVSVAAAEAGLERPRTLRVHTFLLAPSIVRATDHLFTGARQLLAPLARREGLVLVEPPCPIPSVRGVAAWHERMHHDDGHRWFRALVAKAIRSQLADGETPAPIPAPAPP